MEAFPKIPVLSFFIAIAIFNLQEASAQHVMSLTLEEAYLRAEIHYPLSQKRNLIALTENYTTENALKGYLPQLSINGQATYQSDVIKIPVNIPGMDIPSVNKAQYRLSGEINQTLFDGGVIKNQAKAARAHAAVEEQKLTTDLYSLRTRINQLFFGILALNEQIAQTELIRQDIQYGIDKISAAIANGTAIKSNADALRAELMKIRQKTIELKAAQKAFEDMLAQFINTPPGDIIILVKPLPVLTSDAIHRPELDLFEAQKTNMDIQENLLNSRNLPKLGLFLQAGAGNPNPVNMLSNEFSGYYIGGLRLNWMLSGFYTLKNDKALLRIKKQNTDIERDNFLFQTKLQMKQDVAEINKWKALIATDTAIISLRNSVKSTALIQLENGLISPNDYLQEVNAADQAQQNLIAHKIKLLQAQYELKTTTGN